LENVFGQIATAMIQIIRSSNLDWPSQDDLLTQLSSFHVAVAGVVRRQDKRRGSGLLSAEIRLKTELKQVVRSGIVKFPNSRRGSKPHPFSAAFQAPVPFWRFAIRGDFLRAKEGPNGLRSEFAE
jgi:hypothetical protein